MCDIFTQNKHTIHLIVSNLLTTRIYSVVFICEKIREKNIMKWGFLLTALGGVVLVGSAFAVVQCVALNQYTTCDLESYTLGISSLSDIDLVCTTNGVETNVKLISVGSSATTSSTIGGLVDDVDVDRTAVTNLYCYCKMVYPVVSSKWVYAGKGGAGGYDCNWTCGTALLNNASFRQVVFSSGNWLN